VRFHVWHRLSSSESCPSNASKLLNAADHRIKSTDGSHHFTGAMLTHMAGLPPFRRASVPASGNHYRMAATYTRAQTV
jgi:hypothetical protein